jgi:hypothetical protein
MKFAIEYKPREPRVSMFFSSAAKTLLAIGDMDVPNVGILRLVTPLAGIGRSRPSHHSRGLLYGIDVNDNFRAGTTTLLSDQCTSSKRSSSSTRSACAGRVRSSTSSIQGRTRRGGGAGIKRCGHPPRAGSARRLTAQAQDRQDALSSTGRAPGAAELRAASGL